MMHHSIISAVADGGVIDLCALTAADVTRDKLAGPLSRINRFNGRTPQPWSVAAHSVLVSGIIEDLGGGSMAQAAGLLHDAHEAILGDWTSPAVEFAGVQSQPVGPSMMRNCIAQAKNRVDTVIVKAWHVEFLPNLMLTKEADRVALEAEMICFLGWKGPLVSHPKLLSRAKEKIIDLREAGVHEHGKAKDLWLFALEHFVSAGVLSDPEATVA